MKTNLLSKSSGNDSSKPSASVDTKVPRGPMTGPLAFAHYLGLPETKAKAAAKTTSVTATATRKAAATPAPSAKRATVSSKDRGRSTTALKSGATRERCAMPFTSEMGGFKRTAREERAADTLHVPEVVNGVATGSYLEVDRHRKEAPKLDSSSIASRILAVAKRAFGK